MILMFLKRLMSRSWLTAAKLVANLYKYKTKSIQISGNALISCARIKSIANLITGDGINPDDQIISSINKFKNAEAETELRAFEGAFSVLTKENIIADRITATTPIDKTNNNEDPPNKSLQDLNNIYNASDFKSVHRDEVIYSIFGIIFIVGILIGLFKDC